MTLYAAQNLLMNFFDIEHKTF